MRRLLATTDLSERSDHALRPAIRLAAETGAGLDGLYVVDDDQPAEFLARTPRLAEEYLNRQVATFIAGQAQARIQVRVSDAFRVIVDEAVARRGLDRPWRSPAQPAARRVHRHDAGARHPCRPDAGADGVRGRRP